MFFILNNRLCKRFSWLLYLEFSYINCFPHTSSSSSPCWRTESQEISAIEKRLNWVWVLYSIAHPLALWNSFSNCCHVWSKWHQCFQSGILSTSCFLSLGQHFFSAFQTVCDVLKNKNGNAWYFPSFPSCLLEKKISLTGVKQISPVKLEWVCTSLHYAQLNSFPKWFFLTTKHPPAFHIWDSKWQWMLRSMEFHFLLQLV